MPITLSRNTKFIAAVSIQLIIIAVLILSKLSVSAAGTEVLLQIEPVDPRDLLRGDYATFSYSVSFIEPGLVMAETVREGETVYVVLRRHGRLWEAAKVTKEKPGDDEVFLKGKVAEPGLQNWRRRGTSLHIIYGIEEYFIPEGKGAGIGRWRMADNMAVAKVAVDQNGEAVLKEILVDGKPWP